MALDRLQKWARELKAQVMTLWFSRSHPDTPVSAKILAAVVVAYALSPIDLIPDFIPVLGYLDDLILVPIGIYLTLKLLPPHVIAESRSKADLWLADKNNKPGNYFAAAVIVLIWVGVAAWIWSVCSR